LVRDHGGRPVGRISTHISPAAAGARIIVCHSTRYQGENDTRWPQSPGSEPDRRRDDQTARTDPAFRSGIHPFPAGLYPQRRAGPACPAAAGLMWLMMRLQPGHQGAHAPPSVTAGCKMPPPQVRGWVDGTLVW